MRIRLLGSPQLGVAAFLVWAGLLSAQSDPCIAKKEYDDAVDAAGKAKDALSKMTKPVAPSGKDGKPLPSDVGAREQKAADLSAQALSKALAASEAARRAKSAVDVFETGNSEKIKSLADSVDLLEKDIKKAAAAKTKDEAEHKADLAEAKQVGEKKDSIGNDIYRIMSDEVFPHTQDDEKSLRALATVANLSSPYPENERLFWGSRIVELKGEIAVLGAQIEEVDPAKKKLRSPSEQQTLEFARDEKREILNSEYGKAKLVVLELLKDFLKVAKEYDALMALVHPDPIERELVRRYEQMKKELPQRQAELEQLKTAQTKLTVAKTKADEEVTEMRTKQAAADVAWAKLNAELKLEKKSGADFLISKAAYEKEEDALIVAQAKEREKYLPHFTAEQRARAAVAVQSVVLDQLRARMVPSYAPNQAIRSQLEAALNQIRAKTALNATAEDLKNEIDQKRLALRSQVRTGTATLEEAKGRLRQVAQIISDRKYYKVVFDREKERLGEGKRALTDLTCFEPAKNFITRIDQAATAVGLAEAAKRIALEGGMVMAMSGVKP